MKSEDDERRFCIGDSAVMEGKRSPQRASIALAAVVGSAIIWLCCCTGLRRTNGEALLAESDVPSKSAPSGAREAASAFWTLADDHRITRVVVRYRLWNVSTRVRRSERAIFNEPVDCEVVVGRHMFGNRIIQMAKCLAMCTAPRRSSELKDTGEVDRCLDFCLGVICYAEEREVIRFALSRCSPPAVSINGEVFDLSMPLVSALRPLLPPAAYDGVLMHILMQWAPLPEQTGSIVEELRELWLSPGAQDAGEER